MLLTAALWQSEHGIATRRKLIGLVKGKQKFEYHCATVNSRGHIHIMNGRNGTIRRDSPEDHLRDDWEPFAPSKVGKYRPKKSTIQTKKETV